VKLTKTLVLPLAGLLVVIGAGAVLATTGMPAGGEPVVAPAAATPTPTPSPSPKAKVSVQDTLLTDVLDGLVSKGTITAAQKAAILDGLQAKRDQIAADRKAAADKLKAERQQLKDFLSDGQITQDELNQLPADSPIRQLTSLMADGKITIDELRTLGNGILRDLGGLGNGGRGFGHGFFGGGKWGAPNASPAPTAGTSG
jgi:polyhydroxyalkanoate synthesis regulator phasin